MSLELLSGSFRFQVGSKKSKFQEEQNPSTNGWYKWDGIELDDRADISKEHLVVLIIKDKEFKVGSLFQGW